MMTDDEGKNVSGDCRFCGTELHETFVDLGTSPLCEAFVSPSELNAMDAFYPLHAYVCEKCFLVQVGEFVSPDEIFSEYAYFSSFSDTWVEHAKHFTETATTRFGIGTESRVMEVASNDGYMLQHFVAKGIPVLGIEPAANIAKVARLKGIPTVVEFLGKATADTIVAEHGQADLLIGNNVLAHVPDLNDFVAGLKTLLKPHGVLTMEFPHLESLVKHNQFDTIYHEHFSYFSFTTVEKIFAHHGLCVFDIDMLSTHGGSLRVYAGLASNGWNDLDGRVVDLRSQENDLGMNQLAYYSSFAERVKETKRTLLEFLIGCKREGKTIVGYGAPGKGNTLLNYCGIGTDFLDYTVDRNPYKQGKYTPGTRIPVHSPDKIPETKPDFLLILPWNLRDEIIEQNAGIREWGGKFVVPIPIVEVVD